MINGLYDGFSSASNALVMKARTLSNTALEIANPSPVNVDAIRSSNELPIIKDQCREFILALPKTEYESKFLSSMLKDFSSKFNSFKTHESIVEFCSDYGNKLNSFYSHMKEVPHLKNTYSGYKTKNVLNIIRSFYILSIPQVLGITNYFSSPISVNKEIEDLKNKSDFSKSEQSFEFPDRESLNKIQLKLNSLSDDTRFPLGDFLKNINLNNDKNNSSNIYENFKSGYSLKTIQSPQFGTFFGRCYGEHKLIGYFYHKEKNVVIKGTLENNVFDKVELIHLNTSLEAEKTSQFGEKTCMTIKTLQRSLSCKIGKDFLPLEKEQTIIYKNGDKYTGFIDVEKLLPLGKGVMNLKDGFVLDGEFDCDSFTGNVLFHNKLNLPWRGEFILNKLTMSSQNSMTDDPISYTKSKLLESGELRLDLDRIRIYAPFLNIISKNETYVIHGFGKRMTEEYTYEGDFEEGIFVRGKIQFNEDPTRLQYLGKVYFGNPLLISSESEAGILEFKDLDKKSCFLLSSEAGEIKGIWEPLKSPEQRQFTEVKVETGVEGEENAKRVSV